MQKLAFFYPCFVALPTDNDKGEDRERHATNGTAIPCPYIRTEGEPKKALQLRCGRFSSLHLLRAGFGELVEDFLGELCHREGGPTGV
jgi:hypothetical protein